MFDFTVWREERVKFDKCYKICLDVNRSIEQSWMVDNAWVAVKALLTALTGHGACDMRRPSYPFLNEILRDLQGDNISIGTTDPNEQIQAKPLNFASKEQRADNWPMRNPGQVRNPLNSVEEFCRHLVEYCLSRENIWRYDTKSLSFSTQENLFVNKNMERIANAVQCSSVWGCYVTVIVLTFCSWLS